VNYSQVQIANVALQRIGARGTISSINENSPNAIKVLTCWDVVFQEVLSERDWKFAKTRVELQQNAQGPAGGYLYAYVLPSDFLRLCRPREIPQERRIANAAFLGWGGGGGWYGGGASRRWDLPVWPREVDPYITETVLNPPPPTGGSATYTTNLLTNYPGLNNDYANVPPIIINYIRLITDLTQLLPGFVNCLANRLAAELAIPITEDKQKAQGFMETYLQTLNGAQAQTECDDYLQDESGSQTWVTAGRYFGFGGGWQ
jgi:hypothetical protein